MMKIFAPIWADFIALFFPRLCLACENPLPRNEPFICLECQVTLPQTDFHEHKINYFTEKFNGRVPLEAAAALFYFTKKSKTQHLIHQIKYNDKREAAVDLGRFLGRNLVQSPHFQGIDFIIPVPLHNQKKILRGYNQAEVFADGLSDILNIPVEKQVLLKIKMTDSQTRKSRLERLKNTEDVFQLNNPSLIIGKSILIVDDVMTSGATLEACALAVLEEVKDVKISFATIAFAK
jgi:ComF family protein